MNEAALSKYFEILEKGMEDLPGMTDYDLAKFNNCAINELDDIIEMSREWTECHFY